MSVKLTGNGMWESSRMMLPEHKEQHVQRRLTLVNIERPSIDEQTIEDNFRILQDSWKTGCIIHLKVYDPNEIVEVSGHVDTMDPFMQRLKLIHDYKRTWIEFSDILQVTYD